LNELLIALGLIFLGYISGSMTFALWVTRIIIGVDVRDAGSHHATTTNTIRQAGWGAGAIVFALDIAKGYIPTYLVSQFSPYEWAIPLTAMAAVAGHCWPLLSGLRGGMGLATAGGSILAVYPLGMLIGLGILITLALTIKHSARAGFITGILLAPAFWLAGERGIIIWLAAAVGVVIAVRFLSDWNRKYRELWLDRERAG
jgi:glycerol-3-phosphate acyltransferase PlsY